MQTAPHADPDRVLPGGVACRLLRWCSPGRGTVRLPRRRAVFLPALLAGAGRVAGGPLASLGTRGERLRALAGQPQRRRPLSRKGPLWRASLPVGCPALRCRTHGASLRGDGGAAPVVGGQRHGLGARGAGLWLRRADPVSVLQRHLPGRGCLGTAGFPRGRPLASPGAAVGPDRAGRGSGPDGTGRRSGVGVRPGHCRRRSCRGTDVVARSRGAAAGAGQASSSAGHEPDRDRRGSRLGGGNPGTGAAGSGAACPPAGRPAAGGPSLDALGAGPGRGPLGECRSGLTGLVVAANGSRRWAPGWWASSPRRCWRPRWRLGNCSPRWNSAARPIARPSRTRTTSTRSASNRSADRACRGPTSSARASPAIVPGSRRPAPDGRSIPGSGYRRSTSGG